MSKHTPNYVRIRYLPTIQRYELSSCAERHYVSEAMLILLGLDDWTEAAWNKPNEYVDIAIAKAEAE